MEQGLVSDYTAGEGKEQKKKMYFKIMPSDKNHPKLCFQIQEFTCGVNEQWPQIM